MTNTRRICTPHSARLRRLLPALVGGYADAIGGEAPFKDNYALLKKLSEM